MTSTVATTNAFSVGEESNRCAQRCALVGYRLPYASRSDPAESLLAISRISHDESTYGGGIKDSQSSCGADETRDLFDGNMERKAALGPMEQRSTNQASMAMLFFLN